jgi:hypothetical protein
MRARPLKERNRQFIQLFMGLVLVVSGATNVWGQSAGSTSGVIAGTVRDPQGALVSGAMVRARNLATGAVREAKSSANGDFTVVQLVSGDYEVTVAATGFQAQTGQLTVTIGSTVLYDAQLKLTSFNNDDITVLGGGYAVEVNARSDASKTASATTLDRNTIENLPINQRSFLDFSLTAPRVTPDRVPAQGVTATSGLSFNGQAARFNNVTIDGLDNNDIGPGTVRTVFSQDAVQEFQILSDSYSAEFGRALGGVINIVTRSGGNDFHGGLFFFQRTDETSARDAFAAVKPNFERYQFGATASGPIKREKAFFFLSFERLSNKQNPIVTISDSTVQAAQRLGLGLRNGPNPTSAGDTTFLARTDLQITPNTSAYFRYNLGGRSNSAFETFGGLTGQTSAGLQNLDDQTLAAGNTYTNVGLNLINETRFLFSRREQTVTPPTNDPQVQIFSPEGLVTFGRGTFLTQFRKFNYYQFVNNVTLLRGRQQFKFGVDILVFTNPGNITTIPVFPGGAAIFGALDFRTMGGPLLSADAAFNPQQRTPSERLFLQLLAAGLPSTIPGFPQLPLADIPLPSLFQQGFGDSRVRGSVREYALFIQDDIKLRSNLLLKLGIRYDLNRILLTPKNNGNFAPRIALSYRPARLDRLNLRAAYGLFFALQPAGPSGLAEEITSNRLQILGAIFPFAVIPFNRPGRSFPESLTVPAEFAALSFPQTTAQARVQSDLRNTYAQEVSTGLDFFLDPNTVFSATYNYVRGLKVFSTRNINPIVRPVVGNPLASVLFGRVDPSQGEVFEFQAASDSYYHGLTLSFNRRLGQRFNFMANYTVSKAIDNFVDFRIESGRSELGNSLDPGNERGLSLQDARQRFVLSGTWELNYTRNFWLRNFQLSTIVNLDAGRPYNLLAGVDLNGSGDLPPADRPLGIGRNAGITPGFANLDLRLARKFIIPDKAL